MTSPINCQRELSHQLDYHVGKRVKARREKLGLNQAELGDMIGVSYQQIQKYERGENKIPAGRLYQIANFLNVNTDYFFQGIKFSEDKDSKKGYLNIVRKNNLNILLVEDNPADEMLTMEALSHAKCKNNVFVVHDGFQAMQYLRKHGEYSDVESPDIIILDLNIPRKSGLEVLKDIRRDRDFLGVPIVILTNSISPKDLDESYKYNISGYVSKSFDIDEFNRKIDLIVSYWTNVAILPSMQLVES